MKKFIFFTFLFFSLSMGNAFAQSCDKAGKNPKWVNGLMEMQTQLEAGNNDAVIETARALGGICDSSPIYLYMAAAAFKAKGDVAKARDLIAKASDATYDMATAPNVAQKIWYLKYELEHPELTAESVQAKYEALEQQYAAQNENAKAIAKAELEKVNLSLYEEQDARKNAVSMAMWTGTGIGGAGLAMVITGLVLVLKEDKPISINEKSNDNQFYTYGRIEPEYTVGYSLIGAGAGLAVAGAVVAGIFGYQYTHLEEDSTLSFSLSPTSASLSVTF